MNLETVRKRGWTYSDHRTAHHEAGHAVIGRVLGLDGGLVTRVKEYRYGITSDGRAVFREGTGTVEEHIILCLAGWETERVFGFDNEDNEMTEGAGHDRAEIGLMLLKADQPIDLERLRRKTRRLVGTHRDKIGRVAKVLLERGTLQAEEIDALIQKD